MDMEDAEKFLCFVDVKGDDECWDWTGYIRPNGYRTFSTHGTPVYAHRFSWEMHNGPIPEGLFVCHHCDNRKCVNPQHLFLGSQMDNIHDAITKGRTSVGESHGRRKLTVAQVLSIRKDPRFHKEIAKEYGVSTGTIGSIKSIRTWKCLVDPEYTPHRNIGEDHRSAKLTEEQVLTILSDPRSQKVIAAEYGINPSSVFAIKHRRKWKHLTTPHPCEQD